VVIVAGETGSGKTTQLPKMCLEAGGGRKGRIACTQPRRVAAQSVSRRVAEELGVEWGREVGCKIRFTDRTVPGTVIKFITDGMLLAELGGDSMLREYDTIIIDEAHERSLNIDFLLGHLNQLRTRRPDLRILITSATIDTEKFSQAFDQAPIIEVSGRLYPVEIIYAPVDEILEDRGEFTHLDAVAAAVDRIHSSGDRGDILVFLPTERDIREVMDLLTGRRLGATEILPLFGRLGGGDQQRVFTRIPRRKIIVATNIAETSLTIPGIRFVIDTGEARISRFNSRTRTQRLPIEPISQSSANQRMGRCGRVEDGVCIRLYSELDYEERPIYTPPEILRSSLAEVILRMKAYRLGKVEEFPFIDPPPAQAIRAGYNLLEELGALDGDRELTAIGRELARLPVDPTMGRMILQARQEGMVDEVLVVASALSIQDPRDRPAEARQAADEAHRTFVHPHSDFLTLLKIWETYHEEAETLSQGRLRKFCRAHFISYARMREWRDLHNQLKRALASPRQKRAHRTDDQAAPVVDEKDFLWGGVSYRKIHRSLLTGLLGNVARREEGNEFRMAGDRRVLVFPGSTLFLKTSKRAEPGKKRKRARSPEWIVSGEVVETTRVFARTTARIDPEWIIELGNHVCRFSYTQPVYEEASGRVAVRESVRIHGLEVRRRSVGYGRMDPEHATELFIRQALVEPHPHDDRYGILTHNQGVREKAEVLQTRLHNRRHLDLDEAAYRCYIQAIGNHPVSSWVELNRLVRKKGGSDFIRLTETQLLGDAVEEIDPAAFPDSVTLDNSALPLVYAYRPGQETDGVTLKLSARQARNLQPSLLDWLVPGHLEEKVNCLLRGLPKELRRSLFPIADKASRIAAELKPTGNGLIESLAVHLETVYGVRTVPGDWKSDAVPDHLRVRVEVEGHPDRPLATGRDLRAIQTQLDRAEKKIADQPSGPAPDAWTRLAGVWERESIRTWDFPDPPERIQVTELAGLPVYAWPGLRVESNGVSLRLFCTKEDADVLTPTGCAQLLEYDLKYELAWIQRDLKDLARIGPLAATLTSIDALRQGAYESIRRHLCGEVPDPFTRERYQRILDSSKDSCRGLVPRFIDQVEVILNARQEAMTHPHPYVGHQDDIDRLIPPDFLTRTPFERLRDLPRYLRATLVRADKAHRDPVRDERRAGEVRRLEKRIDAIQARSDQSAVLRRGLEEVRWMMEEFRVSQFAQEIGTAGKVSAIRIERRLEATDLQEPSHGLR
jgi:ATP-dependent helicase HrpA